MAFILLIAPRRGEAIVDPDGFATRRMIEYLEQNAEIVNQRRTKIIDIGDWNMVTTLSVTVAHGLTLANIRSVDVMVRSDSGVHYQLIRIGTGSAAVAGGVDFIETTNVGLSRVTAGLFNSVDFDSTSYNRGWITITYIN